MEITWDEKGIAAFEALVKDHERIARKVDLFTVSGAAFHNDPYSMSMAIIFPRPEIPPPQQDPYFFPVLVKSAGGSDGSQTTYASWTYNLYSLSDTSYTTALNASPVQPLCSRARILVGPVTKPSDGSYGTAFFDASGAIQLWDLPEVHGKYACTS